MKVKVRQSHPYFMKPKKSKPVCRTCFVKAGPRAVHLASHIGWHRSEGHKIKTEFGWEIPTTQEAV